MEKDDNYPELFLSSFNNLRSSNLICDFTVKVGNEGFPVHSAVLAAALKYFLAMFTNDMKEIREKSVEIKELDVEGVKQCIEYMYTGGIIPDNKTVQHTLKASHLIQLDGLTSICFRFLQKHISVETCLSTLKLSSLYGRDDIYKIAENYILKNFGAMTSTEMFPLISKSALLHYIEASNATYDVTWQALVRWFSIDRKETGEILLDVIKSTKVTSFPFKFLLDTVLEDPLMKQNKSCQSLVITSLFRNIVELKSNLTTENFFVVKKLAMSDEIPNAEETQKILDKHFENNFEELSKNEGFCVLKEKEIMSWFQSPKPKYSSEKIKWDSALIWVKHDERHRKKVFPNLFKFLKLDSFPLDFLRETVATEILVKESPKCKDLLLKMLLEGKHGNSKALVHHIACLKRINGDIQALNLTNNRWKNLPGLNLTENSRMSEIVNVDDKMFCLDSKNLHQFDQVQMMWIQKQSLETQPSEFAQILSLQQQIYVVDRDFMACYSVTDDVWIENLPGCGLDGEFCTASSVKYTYAMGGKANEEITTDAKHFDPESQTWTEITSLNTGRNGASAAVFHGMVFVVGGWDGKKSLDSVEIYVPLTKTWNYMKSLCKARRFPTARVADNNLYIVGGSYDEEVEPLDTDSIEVYNEDKDEFEIVTEHNFLGGYTPCCAINLSDNDNE